MSAQPGKRSTHAYRWLADAPPRTSDDATSVTRISVETFNVLKTNGYRLEHNFGHGKKTLASVLVTLNLLAFAFHTHQSIADPKARPS